jgi:glycosidase
MQWSAAPNAGFSTGKPWLAVNRNYTQINYEAQKDESDSVLNFYKRLIKLRRGSDVLKYGAFTPVYAKGSVIAYRRTLPAAACTVILNFSGKTVTLPPELAGLFPGAAVVSNTGRAGTAGKLEAWEGFLINHTTNHTNGTNL